jgi:hypothetical protein
MISPLFTIASAKNMSMQYRGMIAEWGLAVKVPTSSLSEQAADQSKPFCVGSPFQDVAITPEVKYRIKVPRIFANMLGGESRAYWWYVRVSPTEQSGEKAGTTSYL